VKRLFKIAVGSVMLLLTVLALAADPPLPVRAAPVPVAYIAVLQNGFSIRHIRSDVRPDGVTRLYTSADDFIDVPSAQISAIESEEPTLQAPAVLPALPAVPQLIDAASGKHLIDAEFIRSVIRAESGFNPKAVSPKGAQGLMQLMPQTAQKLGVADSFDPRSNIDAGTRYLRDLLVQYHGDAAKALAAYNAGPQRVTQYGGIPPYQETRAYVRRVINDYNRAKKSQQKRVIATAKPSAAATKSSQ
jgi:soluble lytic murein transglycosylase-like protein